MSLPYRLQIQLNFLLFCIDLLCVISNFFEHILEPDQMIKYKHALMMYKLFRQCTPEPEFIQLNFQANLNQRQHYHTFVKNQNYRVGSNILLNRLCCLNNTISKSMTDENYLTYKLKCKDLFLGTQ